MTQEGQPKRLDRRDFLRYALASLGGLIVGGGGVGSAWWWLTRESDKKPEGRPMSTVTPERAVRPEALPAWPQTAEQAASTFGVDPGSRDPKRWEKNPDGGWHLKEKPITSAVNPQGYVLEGYRDTKPGKNPDAFVSNGIEVSVQGATVWPVSGEREAQGLLKKMAIPVWDDGKQHPARAVGFSPAE